MTSSADSAAANAELSASAAEQAIRMSLLIPIAGPARSKQRLSTVHEQSDARPDSVDLIAPAVLDGVRNPYNALIQLKSEVKNSQRSQCGRAIDMKTHFRIY